MVQRIQEKLKTENHATRAIVIDRLVGLAVLNLAGTNRVQLSCADHGSTTSLASLHTSFSVSYLSQAGGKKPRRILSHEHAIK